MGQSVVVRNAVKLGDVLLIDTDRSFTGQDGQTITPGQPGHSVPGVLAERLFALGLDIDHVHVLQNTLSVRRPQGWDDAAVGQVVAVTEEFLRFYRD